MTRYAVLHHVGFGEPHFDVLFEWEEGEPLTSFRTMMWPPEAGDVWEERADHRRAYLDYEGPVSGGRGTVRRVAGGAVEVTVTSVDPPALSLRFDDLIVALGDERERRWTVISA